jgi:hypothetical protein
MLQHAQHTQRSQSAHASERALPRCTACQCAQHANVHSSVHAVLVCYHATVHAVLVCYYAIVHSMPSIAISFWAHTIESRGSDLCRAVQGTAAVERQHACSFCTDVGHLLDTVPEQIHCSFQMVLQGLQQERQGAANSVVGQRP